MQQVNAGFSVSTQFNPGILSVVIQDAHALHHAYMPFVRQCGLFIPTDTPYQLGDEVFMSLSLPDEPKRIPLSGRVIWLTPGSADADRVAGIGVQLNSRNARALRQKIESCLAGAPFSDTPTYTM